MLSRIRTALTFVMPGFSAVTGAIGAVFRWMLADWRNGPLVMFAFALAAHIFLIDPKRAALLERASDGWEASIAAHEQTVTNYRNATIRAEAMAAANALRVKREQDAITQEITRDYEVRLANARARAASARRMLQRPSPRADPSSTKSVGVSSSSNAPRGAIEAPGDPRLSAGAEEVISAPDAMNLEERLIATEQAIQLDALISWVQAQSLVSSTAPSAEAK